MGNRKLIPTRGRVKARDLNRAFADRRTNYQAGAGAGLARIGRGISIKPGRRQRGGGHADPIWEAYGSKGGGYTGNPRRGSDVVSLMNRVWALEASLRAQFLWRESIGSGGTAMSGARFDSNGALWITNGTNATGYRISKVLPFQGLILMEFGSTGAGDGQFNIPWDIGVDGADNLYVTDLFNWRIQVFDNDGDYLRQWSTGGVYGPGSIAVDGSDDVFVVEADGVTPDYRIRKYSNTGTVLATFGSKGTGNGQWISSPRLTLDSNGNVYTAEAGSGGDIRVQKFDNSGTYQSSWNYNQGDGIDEIHAAVNLAIDENDKLWFLESRTLFHRMHRYSLAGVYEESFGGPRFGYPGAASTSHGGFATQGGLFFKGGSIFGTMSRHPYPLSTFYAYPSLNLNDKIALSNPASLGAIDGTIVASNYIFDLRARFGSSGLSGHFVTGNAVSPAEPREGDVVVGTDGKDYACLRFHTSSASTRPISGATWWQYLIDTGETGAGVPWATLTHYAPQTRPAFADWYAKAFGSGTFWENTGDGPALTYDVQINEIAALLTELEAAPRL